MMAPTRGAGPRHGLTASRLRPGRRWMMPLVIALAVLADSRQAGAQTPPSPCSLPHPPPICRQVTVPGTPPGSDGGTPDGAAGETPLYPWYELIVGRNGDGEDCWTYSIEWRPTPPPAGRTAQDVLGLIGDFDHNGRGIDACPTEPVFDPAAFARTFWAGLDPPAPTVQVEPGWAVSGLRAYLELQGPPQLSASTATPVGTLTVTAIPSYRVDWGDGSPPTTTAARGVPYPGGPGQITHVYLDAGQVTITVTTTWTASWTVAGRTGGLPAVQRTSELVLPVRQVQAVRQR